MNYVFMNKQKHEICRSLNQAFKNTYFQDLFGLKPF